MDATMASAKEIELLAKIEKLEGDRVKFIAIVHEKVKKLDDELRIKTEENTRLLKRNQELEKNFADIASLGQTKGKKANKTDDDADLLTRAKELLFEKTKICKTQELKIEALTNQIDATKDALNISKDMLSMQSIENDHHQSRVDALMQRVKAERDRAQLIEKKLAISKEKEEKLTSEYETQRKIFQELRSIYEAKINVLTKQVETLKSPTTEEAA